MAGPGLIFVKTGWHYMGRIVQIVCLCVSLSCGSLPAVAADTQFEGFLKKHGFDVDDAAGESDHVVEIDATEESPADSYAIDIGTYSKKTLKIAITSDKEIEFDVPETGQMRVVNTRSRANTVDGKKSHEKIYYLLLFPKKAGKETIKIKNNFLKKDFTIVLNVSEGDDLDKVRKKIGFESYVKPGMGENELTSRFGKPGAETAVFKDDYKVYVYSFPEYEIEYQVLLKGDSVYDNKMRNDDWMCIREICPDKER